jgi:hypothetical protein
MYGNFPIFPIDQVNQLQLKNAFVDLKAKPAVQQVA